MLRLDYFYQNGVLDQWVLIHVGLFYVFSITEQVWNNSLHACNMYPTTIMPFPAWYKKIKHFLQAGQSLKSEGPAQLYHLLTSMWHGMNSTEKIQMVVLINAYSGDVYVYLCK